MTGDPTRAANGDFHVIRMDNLFHVAFRPDSDPEWFRIIGTFFTYERAYTYCDVERVSAYTYTDSATGETHAESHTGDEELAGLRSAPIHLEIPATAMSERDGAAGLVRGVYDGGEHVLPHPEEDFAEHPNEDEPPKDYHERQFARAVAKEADKPTCAECGKPRSASSGRLCRNCYRVTPVEGGDPLTPNQTKVLKFFQSAANPLRLVSATYRKVADGSGIIKASASGVVESLERRGLIEVVERGKPGHECVFRVVAQADRNPKGHDPVEGHGRNDESPVAASGGDAPKTQGNHHHVP